MAKRQTRRGVSLNRGVYERLSQVCAAHNASMASVVETLIRHWLELGTFADGEAAFSDELVVGVKATPAPSPAIVARRQSSLRLTLDARKVEQLRRDFEARANANPCRREQCSILGLHPAHGEARE